MSRKVPVLFIIGRAVSRTFVFLLALSFSLSGYVPGANAAGKTFYVKPGGMGDCSGWASACELQTALAKAVSGDQIWVAAGRYIPTTTGDRSATFQLKAGVAIYGGFAGTESSLEQRDWAANAVILSGDLKGDDEGFTNNGENSLHVVTGDTGATLDGVTVRGGNASYGSNTNGGGMINNNASPALANVIFTNNQAWENGGGVYNSFSNPAFTNVTVGGNAAQLNGGGMYNTNSSPTLIKVIFSGNWAFSDSGGGMYNTNSSPILTKVTFSDNRALSAGGGMANLNGSSPILNRVTFNSNDVISSGGAGAGMLNSTGSSPVLTNVTFTGNGNNGSYGGGMYNSASSPTLNSVTFSGNRSSSASGIYNLNASHPILSNCILWDESGPEIFNDEQSQSTVSACDVQGGYSGAGNINADPLLAPLADYGGGLPTQALLPGSPAIDAASSNCPDTDARGLPRSSPNCDLGAFESQGFTLLKTSGDNQGAFALFPQPLCVAVTPQQAGEPVDGGKVSFSAPDSGPAAILVSSLVTITGGVACTPAFSNGIVGGPYLVTASTASAASVTFSLANIPGMMLYLPMILNQDPGPNPLRVVVVVDNGPGYLSNVTLGYIENTSNRPYTVTLEADIEGWGGGGHFTSTVQVKPVLGGTLPGQPNPFQVETFCWQYCSYVRAVRVAQLKQLESDRATFLPLEITNWSYANGGLSGTARNNSLFALDNARVIVIQLSGGSCIFWTEAVLEASHVQPGQETGFTIDSYPESCVNSNLRIVGQGHAP